MTVDILFYDCAGYIHSYLLSGSLGITGGLDTRSLPGIGLHRASSMEC